MEVQFENSWKNILKDEFEKEYFTKLKNFIIEDKKKYTIYPKENKIFSAFELCKYDDLKIVILGQDPYHGLNQADGLSFSVPLGIKTPPSLKNILKELKNDLGISIPSHGNLKNWAKQGVLLLNTILTVRAGEPSSHKNFGWENFTDEVIKKISENKRNIVFFLWGSYAQKKEVLINANKHLILKAAHPSPLARGAFFGSRPYSKCNNYLKENMIQEIDWNLSIENKILF